MDCVLSGSLLVVFSLFCYAMCVFFEQINSLSLSPRPSSWFKWDPTSKGKGRRGEKLVSSPASTARCGHVSTDCDR